VVGNLLSTAIGVAGVSRRNKLRAAWSGELSLGCSGHVAAPLTEVIGRRHCWVAAPSSMFAGELPIANSVGGAVANGDLSPARNVVGEI
jgi:hypothetical protein